jgi:hypothetical protein
MPSDLYGHIDWAKPAPPKPAAEQAVDDMAAEIRRTTACGRLTTSEVRALIERLVAIGWTPPAKAAP